MEEFGESSPEYQTVREDPSLIDPELHRVGIQQCISHQEGINEIDYRIVYTSPLQRAMMTTVNMFQNHPNKDKIKFVVLPMLREVFYSVSDIAIDCEELMQKYGEGTKAAGGIVFDFSEFYQY